MTSESPKQPPDRLSAWDGPYHVKDHPLVRISIDGVEATGSVVEYCISEGWAKVLKTNPKGEPLHGKRGGTSTRMRKGKIVVWFATDPIPDDALKDWLDLKMGTA